jgi:hypothetical protein
MWSNLLFYLPFSCGIRACFVGDNVGIPSQLDIKMIRTICHHPMSMRLS